MAAKAAMIRAKSPEGAGSRTQQMNLQTPQLKPNMLLCAVSSENQEGRKFRCLSPAQGASNPSLQGSWFKFRVFFVGLGLRLFRVPCSVFKRVLWAQTPSLGPVSIPQDLELAPVSPEPC